MAAISGASAQPARPAHLVALAAAAPAAFEQRAVASTDDAEEFATGSMYLNSSDLELVYDGSNQRVGMRFTSVSVPRGATITRAYVQLLGAFLRTRPDGEALDASVAALLASPLAARDVLTRHYSKTLLFSVEARRGWVEPDLEPLP